MARKNLNNLKSPAVFEAPRRRRKNVSALAGESARSTIGKLRKRCEMFGFTKGQFSLIDLLQAIVIQTGPADVLVSTWTAAGWKSVV